MSGKTPIGTRADYRWFTTIPTRWMDNDVYGHVNNVTYYAGSTPRWRSSCSRTRCSTSAPAPRSGWWSRPSAATSPPSPSPTGHLRRALRPARRLLDPLRARHLPQRGGPVASAEGHFVHVYVSRAAQDQERAGSGPAAGGGHGAAAAGVLMPVRPASAACWPGRRRGWRSAWRALACARAAAPVFRRRHPAGAGWCCCAISPGPAARRMPGSTSLAALSMAGGTALGEELAAAVVALMFAGGSFLEDFAQERARREMTALLARQPRRAARHGPAGPGGCAGRGAPPGDRVLVRQGEVVPVDGRALGPAVLDTAALTGEAMPVRMPAGEPVLSGHHQCRRGLRPAGRTPRRREHLRRHRPAGRAGPGQPGTDGAAGRPLGARLPRR